MANVGGITKDHFCHTLLKAFFSFFGLRWTNSSPTSSSAVNRYLEDPSLDDLFLPGDGDGAAGELLVERLVALNTRHVGIINVI